VALHLEAVLGLESSREESDVTPLEILHLTTALADKVVVVRSVLRFLSLIPIVALAKLHAASQPEFHQQIGEPVNRHEVNLLVSDLPRAGIDGCMHLLHGERRGAMREKTQ
jgi:hypothetical protein